MPTAPAGTRSFRGFGDFQRGGRQGTYSQVAPCKLNLRVQILEGKSSSSDGTLSFRDDGKRFQRLEVFPVGETGGCGGGAVQMTESAGTAQGVDVALP